MKWGDHPNYVFITFQVPDVPKDKLNLKVEPTLLDFEAHSTSKGDKKVKMEFFKEVDAEYKPENLKHTPQQITLKLSKKEKGEDWKSLFNQKAAFLSTDWNDFEDDEEEEEKADPMAQMGGMGGMPGMGGMGGADLSNLDFSNIDPSKFPGLGGAGAGGLDEEDDEEDEEDDEDMPALEGEKPKPAA